VQGGARCCFPFLFNTLTLVFYLHLFTFFACDVIPGSLVDHPFFFSSTLDQKTQLCPFFYLVESTEPPTTSPLRGLVLSPEDLFFSRPPVSDSHIEVRLSLVGKPLLIEILHFLLFPPLHSPIPSPGLTSSAASYRRNRYDLSEFAVGPAPKPTPLLSFSPITGDLSDLIFRGHTCSCDDGAPSTSTLCLLSLPPS